MTTERPSTFHDTLTQRLRLLCERAGLAPYRVSLALGQSRDWLPRKIVGGRIDPRPLSTEDVDKVLEHLKVDADELLRPVLFQGDLALLKRIKLGEIVAGPAAPPEELTARERLQSQGLCDAQGITLHGLATLKIGA